MKCLVAGMLVLLVAGCGADGEPEQPVASVRTAPLASGVFAVVFRETGARPVGAVPVVAS